MSNSTYSTFQAKMYFKKFISFVLAFCFIHVQCSAYSQTQSIETPASSNIEMSTENNSPISENSSTSSLSTLSAAPKDDAYSGSQASEKKSDFKETVNENTGDLNLNYSLADISIPGIQYNLSLNLGYSTAKTGYLGTNGMPSGWEFELPHLDLTNSTQALVRFNGTTYTEDYNWRDSEGYASGLRYVNNHGVTFQRYSTIQSLSLDESQKIFYNFSLKFVDGSMVYFDSYGKPIAKTSRFKHYILYSYFDQGSFESSRLKEIRGSLYSNQVISFYYDANGITLRYPNGGQTRLIIAANKLVQIQNPIGESTVLNYNNSNMPGYVTSVTYSNGLISLFKYNDSISIGNCGSKISKHVISEVLRQDSSLGNSVINNTRYKYGASTTHNYSGFPYISSCSKNAEDSLMESNNFDFKYEVDVTQTGVVHSLGHDSKSLDQKNLTKTTRTYYNFLHLPVRTEVYLSTSQISNVPYYVTEIKYNLTRDIHKMSSSYTQPISSETVVYDVKSKSYKPYSYSENSYDSYGNVTSSTKFNYNFEFQKWEAIEKKTTSYYHFPSNDYSLPNLENEFDFVTGQTYETHYELTDDKKEVAIRTTGLLNSQQQFEPITTQSFNYDVFGRIVSDNTRCISSVDTLCSLGPTNFSNHFSYSFDRQSGILEVQKIDAKNQRWITKIDTSIGKPVVKLSPSGKVLSAMNYDLLGRLVIEKIPALTEGNFQQKQLTYFSFQKNGINKIEEKFDNGYVLGRIYDAIDREIEKYDNFYPDTETTFGNSISSENHRNLSTSQYNSFGKIDKTRDQYHQTTVYLYDASTKNAGILDSTGNFRTIEYDDVNRVETTYLNAAKIVEVQKDNQDKEISKKVFPNSNFKCVSNLNNICSSLEKKNYSINESQFTYDGFGREIKKVKHFVDHHGTFLGSDILETSYNILGKPTSIVFKGHDDIIVSRHLYYDMLGNQVYFTKQKQEKGNILPSYTSEKYQYDELSNLVSVVRQDGKVQKFDYNSDGQLIQKENFSGVTHKYTYYANNLLKTDVVDVPLLSYSKALSFLTENFSYESIKRKLQTFKSYFVSEEKQKSDSATHPISLQWQKDFNEHSSFDSLNYTYNDQGSLTNISYRTGSVIDHLSSVNYNYLSDGKTIKNLVYANGQTISYTYERFGRMLSTRDIKGNTTWVLYDEHDGHPERLKQITDGVQKDVVVFNYYADNETNENGIYAALKNKQLYTASHVLINTTEQISDPLFRESSTVKYSDKGVILKTINNYDDYEHLAQVQSSSSLDSAENSDYSLNYAYDSSGVLLNFQRKNRDNAVVYQEHYDLDSNFNVIQRDIYITGELKRSMSYNYNSMNQLISYIDKHANKNFMVEYDIDGRLVKDDLGNTFTFDNFTDKITQIKNSKQHVVAQYSYYPNGKRMAKMTPQSQALPTSFFYNRNGNVGNELQTSSHGDSVVSYLYDGKNSKVSRSVSNNSKLEATYYAGTKKVINKTFQNIESLSKVTENYFYSPYGEQLDEQGQGLSNHSTYNLADNPYGYENQRMTDKESGLILLDARFYNPRLMRFMSQDTLGVDNKYSYTEGDPVGYADPSGHMSMRQILTSSLHVSMLTASLLGLVMSLATLQAEFTWAAVSGVVSSIMGLTSFALTIASMNTTGRHSANLSLSAAAFAFASGLLSAGTSIIKSFKPEFLFVDRAASVKTLASPAIADASISIATNAVDVGTMTEATMGIERVNTFLSSASMIAKNLQPILSLATQGIMFTDAVLTFTDTLNKKDTSSANKSDSKVEPTVVDTVLAQDENETTL